MDAVDLTMRGWATMNRPSSMENCPNARALFEAALKLDDRAVDALIGLGDALTIEVRFFTSLNADDQIRAADVVTAQAMRLAPNDALVHCVRATVLQLLRMPEGALRECELAIALDRNLAEAHGYAGLMKLLLGRAEETEAHVVEAMRLSPHDPLLNRWHMYIGSAALFLGRLDQAVDALRRSVELNPDFGLAHFFLASALALKGYDVEATEARAFGQRLDPAFTITKFRDGSRSDNPTYLAQRERVYEGMCKAGVPDG